MKSKIPTFVFLFFVALAVFTTKEVVLDLIYFALGIIGFFMAKLFLGETKGGLKKFKNKWLIAIAIIVILIVLAGLFGVIGFQSKRNKVQPTQAKELFVPTGVPGSCEAEAFFECRASNGNILWRDSCGEWGQSYQRCCTGCSTGETECRVPAKGGILGKGGGCCPGEECYNEDQVTERTRLDDCNELCDEIDKVSEGRVALKLQACYGECTSHNESGEIEDYIETLEGVKALVDTLDIDLNSLTK
jgi:hypothetical protein